MLVIKYLLMVGAVAMLVVAAAIILYDVYLLVEYRRRLALNPDLPLPLPRPLRWKEAARLAALSLVPLLLGLSIAVVPSGMAGVRVSEFSGTRPGVLYPGSHLITPLVDSVALYDVRDKVYTTVASEPEKREKVVETSAPEVLKVQAMEGLPIGLAISVRYHLDAARLVSIHNTLPTAIDSEVVQPVIGSAFRGIAPNYTVRDVFAAKREEIRQRASDEITRRLGADGIVVNEVMLREVQLPPEYARGLEGLLLKEQENDQMGVQAEIKQKEVRVAEYEAEADKVREEKKAEADARVRVLQAKAESDAMQYTLPLKEKQIQQTKLESEARKEATIKNAEASAQAKVIDSKAELERRNLLADAEANRIRVTAKADFERMQSEAAVLKQSPLLINKIIAERLSDKLQIMMVPADGKYFFASDVLRGQMPQIMQQDDPSDPPRRVESR
jgi:regulator of protease activity HflC (stomatin/prohibitin superfamily)